MGRTHYSSVKASLVICIVFAFYCTECLAEVCQKIDDCTCVKSNGKVISLRKIDGGRQGPAFKYIPTKIPAGSRLVFDWNPCTNFSEGFGCKNVLVCQKDPIIPADTYSCADSVADFKLESDGNITILYHKLADIVGYKRVVKINLKCDESKFPGEMSGVINDYMLKYATYSANFTSRCACEDGCIPDDDAGGRNFFC